MLEHESTSLPRTRVAVLALSALALLLIVVMLGWVVLWALPDLLAPDQSPRFGPEAQDRARAAARSAALQFIGGLVLAIGACFTAWTVRLTRIRDADQRIASEERLRIDRAANEARFRIDSEGQITERFTRAIEQLGSQESDVRLGGIYALERIAWDSERDHEPVVEILTAFLREHANKTRTVPRGPERHLAFEPSPADITAAIEVLGRRASRIERRPMDLRRIHVTGAHLEDARFQGAVLNGAELRWSNMRGASFADAILSDADLSYSKCAGADLSRAFLDDARLIGVDWREAIVHQALLHGARYEQGGQHGLTPEQLATAHEGD